MGLTPGPSPPWWRGGNRLTRLGFRRAAAEVRGSGGMGSPWPRWSKAAGGAVLGWQVALGGMETSPPDPLSNIWRGGQGWLAPLWSPRGAGGRDSSKVCSIAVGGVSVRVRVGWGAGSGRGAGQDYLAQPALAGWQGDGGVRHGAQTMLTRRPGRGGQGYVSTRRPKGGARTVMPHRTQGGKGSAMTRRRFVPGAGPVVRR